MIKFAKLFNNLNIKKGAMFGIDARVTLAVTSIAAFIVGISYITDINRIDKNKTIDDFNAIKDAILTEYKETYTVKDIPTLLAEKSLDLENGEFDIWGNAYEIDYVEDTRTILDSKVTIKYFYILSRAKNAAKDSLTPNVYSQWESFEPSGDDIVLKFDTFEIEKEIAQVEQNQISLVKNLLENYVAEKIAQNRALCETKDYQILKQCDVNEDGDYSFNEELLLNYMPKDIDDNNGLYYLTQNSIYNTKNEFKSGYINTSSNYQYNMYTFMQVIGGLPDYVRSPRGLVLHFESNKYDNTQAPYYGEIWYDDEVSIF